MPAIDNDLRDALHRRQDRREAQKAIAALLITSAVFCGIVLALSNWIGRTPQVSNVYVTHS